MAELDGKVALVTGGARGQGRAHALALAGAGALVAVADVPQPMSSVRYPLGTTADLAETVALIEGAGGTGLAVACDVRDRAAVHAMVDEVTGALGPIDVLIANAGICTTGPLADIDEDVWRETVDTNLGGVLWSIQAVTAGMVERGFGRIVATSSMAARGGSPNLSHYTATKFGVVGLVRCLALELAGTGVTVNAVCPTTVHTAMVMHESNYRLFCPDLAEPTLDDARRRFAGMNPLHLPWLEPEDVAREVLHLVTDRGITSGAVIEVSLGISAMKP